MERECSSAASFSNLSLQSAFLWILFIHWRNVYWGLLYAQCHLGPGNNRVLWEHRERAPNSDLRESGQGVRGDTPEEVTFKLRWAFLIAQLAKNTPAMQETPGLGKSPGQGKGYPLQYSGLENCMDCIVHGVAKSQTWLSNFHLMDKQELARLKEIGNKAYQTQGTTWT